MIADQNLGDLNGVKRRALAQIVGDHPEIQAVRNGIVFADSSHKGRVLARGILASAADRFTTVSTLIDSELPQNTGTRTVVAVTGNEGSPRTFRVSLIIFHSSLV